MTQKEKHMKKILFIIVTASMFVSALALGDKNMNKIHRGMKKDGKKVNCAYCHKGTDIPKKGQDFDKFLKTETCAGDNCHK